MEKAIFIVAHPDDFACAMSGLGLLMAGRYAVEVWCATRGERGIAGKGLKAAAAIREPEERRVAAAVGAELRFLDLIDGEVMAALPAAAGTVGRLLAAAAPRAVFGHWPVDNHRDHSAISEITRQGIRLSGVAIPEFYYFESALGLQTMRFTPDVYIDITAQAARKTELIRMHASQNPDDALAQMQLRQDRFRGMECGYEYAECVKSATPLTNRTRSVLFTV